jgi:hypothetical protein
MAQAQTLETDVVKEIPAGAVFVGNNSSRGRPVKLDLKRFLAICGWIEKGRTNCSACKLEQIDYTTFRFHVRKKRRWNWRYELASTIRDEYLRDLHLSNIARHAESNWMASAWILERKFPHLYALRAVHRPDGDQKPSEPEIPAEVLARHRALMLEMAREDEAAAAQKQLTSNPSETAIA